jgi:ABC-type amino acid transport substrate-binding protein
VAFAAPYTEDGLALLTAQKEQNFIDIFGNLLNNRIIREMTVMLFVTALLGTFVLWILSRRFDHKDIVGRNSLHTFFKGWMMLVIGSGIYKMGTSPPSMSVVAVSNFVRTVLMAIFVGTTTTLVMKSNEITISNHDVLRSALLHGIGVDGGTISQTWLELQADGLLPIDQQLRLIKPLKGDQQMINALESRKVGSIMADSARIAYLHSLMAKANNYELSQENFNVTPQGFILGSRLDPDTAKKIDVAIAALRFDGMIEEVLTRWEPRHSK